MAFSIKQWLNGVGSGTSLDAPSVGAETRLDAASLRDLEARLSGYTDGPRPVISSPRPPASDYAAGTQVYDTTLHKPLWSDGSTWRDSAGNDVASGVAAPTVPTLLGARATSSGTLSISWTASTGSVSSYIVRRATTPGGPYTTIGSGITGTEYVDTGLSNGTTYHYVVAASGPGGISANSAEVTGSPNAADLSVPYDSTSEWNTPIPSNPSLHTNSAAIVAKIASGGDVPPSPNELTCDPDQYTIPVYPIDSTVVPLVPVQMSGGYHTFDAGDATSVGHGYPAGTQMFPIPNNIQLSQGSDSQMILVDAAAGIEWGLWQLQGGPGAWTATNGFRSHIKSPDAQGNRYSGWFKTKTAGRGGGSSYLAGLVRPWEIAQGHIDHALAWGFNSPLGYGVTDNGVNLPPAPKSDGQGIHIDNPPEGVRMQLDPSFDVNTLAPTGLGPIADEFQRIIAICFQTHGAFLIDHAGSTKIYIEDRVTAHWSAEITRRAIKNIPLNQMRIVAPPGLSAPAAPVGVSATPGNTTNTIRWTQSTDGTVYRYDILRSLSGGGPFTKVGEVRGVQINSSASSPKPPTQYVDAGLTNGTTYYYVVQAVNASLKSNNSAVVNGAPILAAPAVPILSPAVPGVAQVSLSWGEVAGAESYAVKRATTPGGSYTTIASTVTGTTYTDTGRTNGTTYYYVVTATNTIGTSANSNEVSATPQARLFRGLLGSVSQNSTQLSATGNFLNPSNPGDTIVIGVVGNNVSVAFTSVVDSKGNTYTGGTPITGGNQGGRTQIFSCIGATPVDASDTFIITSAAGRQVNAVAVAIGGVTATDLAVGASGGAVSSASPDSGSTAATAQPDIAIGLVGVANPNNTFVLPLPTDWNLIGSGIFVGNLKGLGMAYKIATAPGAERFNPTLSAIDGWHALVQTFK